MTLTVGELRKKVKLVGELDSIKKQIKNNYMSDVLANSGFSDYTTKLFEPITTSQAKLSELKGERKKKLEDSQNLMLEGIGDKLGIGWKGSKATTRQESHVGRKERVGASSFLDQMMSITDGTEDKLYGLKFDGNNFKLGDSNVSLSDNDTKMHIGDDTFDITHGVIYLLTMRVRPANDGLVTTEDVDTYIEIIVRANLRISRSSHMYSMIRSYGWVLDKSGWVTKEYYDKLVQERVKKYVPSSEGDVSGSGLRNNKLFLPSNPKSLLDMLGYRVGRYQAGNDGLRNTIIDITDELCRQKVIDTHQYKDINKIIVNGSKKKVR